jgi:DNA-binding NtrC family response regulator
MRGRILIVDDERNMCELIQTDLRMRDFDASCCTSADQALQQLTLDADFDAVLTDVRMPGISGLQLCEQIATRWPQIPVVVMTAFGSLETAVAAIRVGAYDFVTKPIEMDLLAMTLQRAVKHYRLQEQVKRLSEAVQRREGIGGMIGESPVMQQLYDQLQRIADAEASVLITGESGTGKELVAQAIHEQSRRSRGPFVAVNCAALPDTLLESELFGHARGAFTDARADRKGLILQAQGGTLLMDEIAEMPPAMQAKLLRALEENRLRPVGGDRELPFDVRILSATNRDLEVAVEENRFREDLYFRINVIQLDVPPLRARGTDVLLLARRFVEVFAGRSGKQVVGISDRAAERLLAYSWPGNVRELRNVIERAVALTRHEQLVVEDLPEKVREYRASQVYIGGEDPTELAPLEAVEQRYIVHVLKAVGGNKSTAARILGLDRKTLYRKLKQYELDDGDAP